MTNADNDKRSQSEGADVSEAKNGDSRLEWQTPVLLVQDMTQTHGGNLTNPHADGHQYS